MSDQLTKQDLLSLEDNIDKKIDSLEGRIDKKIDKAVNDLSEIIGNLAQSMHDEIVEVKQEIVDLKASHDRLLNTIDGFIGRIDTYETELAARDAQFARLLEWAKEVSKKTGIPIKGL
jgi:predicted  nucleic acid-binding Zn-ribbon protein